MDEEATVGGLPISPEAGRAALEEAGERPYGEGVAHLRGHHAMGMGPALGLAALTTFDEYRDPKRKRAQTQPINAVMVTC